MPDRENQKKRKSHENNKTENSHFANLVDRFRTTTNYNDYTDTYNSPVVYKTIFVDQVEVVYEESLELEMWMISPFENSIAEADIQIEDWMTSPFVFVD